MLVPHFPFLLNTTRNEGLVKDSFNVFKLTLLVLLRTFLASPNSFSGNLYRFGFIVFPPQILEFLEHTDKQQVYGILRNFN